MPPAPGPRDDRLATAGEDALREDRGKQQTRQRV